MSITPFFILFISNSRPKGIRSFFHSLSPLTTFVHHQPHHGRRTAQIFDPSPIHTIFYYFVVRNLNWIKFKFLTTLLTNLSFKARRAKRGKTPTASTGIPAPGRKNPFFPPQSRSTQVSGQCTTPDAVPALPAPSPAEWTAC